MPRSFGQQDQNERPQQLLPYRQQDRQALVNLRQAHHPVALQGQRPALPVDTRASSNTILVGANSDPSAGLGYRLMRTTDGHLEPTQTSPGTWANVPSWMTVIDNGDDPIVSVAFAPSRPGKVYAISAAGKVFRKDDVNAAGGWDQLGRWSASHVRQLAINPQCENRLYALTGT